MLLTNPTTRTKTLLALATGIALILSGCTVKAKPVTNVTVSSATLNAEVSCGSGSVSWQLREAGQAQWRTVAVKPAAHLPEGSRRGAAAEDGAGLEPGRRPARERRLRVPGRDRPAG